MDSIRTLDLRDRIQERRFLFPNLSSYLGPWGMVKAIQRDERMNKATPELLAFKEDLLRYIDFGLSFLKEQANVRDLTEARFVIAFSLDALNDEAFDEKEDILSALLPFYGDGEDILPQERAMLLYLIVLAYSKDHFPWRGKPYAKALLDMAEANDPLPYEIYRGLLVFYLIVLDRPDAERVALIGAKNLRQRGDEKRASALENEAAKQAIKHDPIESTPAFQEAYDEVMEEAMKRYLALGETRIVFTLWEYMEEGFAKKGISWKNPKRMNPEIRFD